MSTQTLPTQMPLAQTIVRNYANRRAICAESNNFILYCTSVSLASIILLPAIPFTFSSRPSPASKASISSPPPILLPLTSTFGTVRLPVLFASAAWRPGPKGWVSSSTTYGAGTIVYFSSNIRLALAEKGQYDLLKIITVFHRLIIRTSSPLSARHGLRRTGPFFQDRVQLHLYFMILFALDLLFFLHLLPRWVLFLLSVYDHRSLFP